MVDSLAHRGPDQTGTFVDDSIGFAHTRLKIVDLVSGRQPMSDLSGQVSLIYNGEIWNYRELRTRLRQNGHSFTQESDTEVVLNAYLEYGDEFAEHLDGMFALAIWDARREAIVLARDRMGKKPLYYCEIAGDLVFGSEIKAILCSPLVRAQLDPQALSDFLVLRYVPAPRTMFEGIRKLPPATVKVFDRAGDREHRYWQLPLRGERHVPQNAKELYSLVRSEIRRSVDARLMSDVPLGALLSGGVDSSILVAEASALLAEPLKTFSVRFADSAPAFDESPFARRIAEQFRTEHHEVTVGEADLLAAIPTAAWHRDEPMSEPSEVPTYLVCSFAKQYATVLLSGEGGDELFAGYPKYAYDWLAGYSRHLPPAILAQVRRSFDFVPPRFRRFKIAARSVLETDEARRWATWFGAFSESEKNHLLSNGGPPVAPADRHYWEQVGSMDSTSSLERLLYLDTAIWLPDNLLMKGDKMSMAAGTEARMPFLDYRLVELAASIPVNRRIRPFVSKYLLKEAYTDLFPRDFLYRRKVGFQVPIGDWLRSDRFAFLRNMLVGERARARELFDSDTVSKLVDEHINGRANHQSKLFVLLSIELWHRLFLDSQYSTAPHWQNLVEASEVSSLSTSGA
jgi:asparagine synthase (glutamine-hydrolysing)